MGWWADFIIRRRVAVLIVIAAITALAAWKMSQGRIESTMEAMVVVEADTYTDYREFVDEFGGDEFLEIAIHSDKLFTLETLAKIAALREALTEHEWVQRVVSITDIYRIQGGDGLLKVVPYYDEVETADDAARMRELLLGDDIYRGLLLSDDAETTAIIIELISSADRRLESMPDFNDFVHAQVAKAEIDGDIHYVGMPAQLDWLVHASWKNLLVYFPITVGLLFVVVFFIYRRFWPVLLTFAVAAIAIVWTMAVGVLWNEQLNLLVTLVPILVLVVSFSDVIHLINYYLLQITEGVEREEAIRETVREVGLACIFTSLTTFIGFSSMALTPIAVIRQVAFMMGFGVGVALIIALTLVPILFHYFKPRGYKSVGLANVRSGGGFIGAVLHWSFILSTRYPKLVIALAAVITGAAIYGTAVLEVETDFVKRFEEGHPLRVDTEFVTENLTGTNAAELFITAGAEDGVLEPEVLGAVKRIQDRVVDELEVVDSAGSVLDMIELIARETSPDPATAQTMPATKAEAAQYVELFSMSGGDGLDRLLNFPRDRMRVGFRLNEDGFFAVAHAADEIERITAEEMPAGITSLVSGFNVMVGRQTDNAVVGQRNGLLLAFFTIAVVMTLITRSIRIGAWSMLPNTLPMLFLFGYISFVWEHFDTDAIMIACVAIGIAVDDTIHFLTRYKIEYERHGGNRNKAIEESLNTSGRAIIQTTTILCCGFSVLLMADYLTMDMFGGLLPMTLIAALLADLLLLPAIITVGWLGDPVGNKDGR